MAEANSLHKNENVPVLIPDRNDCIHTACYCEENVWKLCQHIRLRAEKTGDHESLENAYCVFISNHDKKIPIWHQRASDQPEGLVVWDYHVILVAKQMPAGKDDVISHNHVFDLDTTLPFPCEFEKYIKRAIRSDEELLPQYRRLFRVIPASEFLDTFASDRSHMLKDDGVTYLATPPFYPPIKTQNSNNNIADFISMDSDKPYGSVMSSRQLWNTFSQQNS